MATTIPLNKFYSLRIHKKGFFEVVSASGETIPYLRDSLIISDDGGRGYYRVTLGILCKRETDDDTPETPLI